MKRIPSILMIGIFIVGISACNNQQAHSPTKNNDSTMTATSQNNASVKEEPVTYTAGNTTLKGYIAYDDKKQGKRPIVLIAPEWWGLTDYPRMRAKMLAEMGYLAMAVDMYGDGKLADNPADAQKAAMPFYQNPQMGKERLDAALAKAKSYPQADTSQVIIIGYCFGGSMALNYGKMDGNIAGVVSFHGGLETVPPHKGTKTQFLICHGAKDSFVPQSQVDAFKKSMDSAGVKYRFIVYDNATHAFTNPNATEIAKKFNMPIAYNRTADSASWEDMKSFFHKILK